MIKKYTLFTILILSMFFLQSCGEEELYIPVAPTNLPVNVNLSEVPYQKLSQYNFFNGDLKNQKPSQNVLPYEPASSLFGDYSKKRRFVWMPKGTKATYKGDDNVFDFPIGAVLIKTFYYDNVQPNNTTKIIETRLLIRVEGNKSTPTLINNIMVDVKSSGWKAYDYIWNEAQTDAILETTGNGVIVPISWLENGISKSVNYKTPAQTECTTCHKINKEQVSFGQLTIPIGPKPQNLNTVYNYNATEQNQIAKWKSIGYLGDDIPLTINSSVNYTDTSKSLELRARSYIDINCAHCHRDGGHCDYTAMRFNFSNTNLTTFGVCMVPSATVPGGPFVINGGNADQSELIIRLGSNEGSLMMPLIGRRLVHDEGLKLMKDWINTLPQNCR